MAFGDPTVVSWNGNNINDGASYQAGFRPGLEWGLPDVQAVLAPRTGRWPLVAGIARPGWRLQLEITIVDLADLRDLRDQLLAWFDPEDETPKEFIIQDSGANSLYVMAICESLQPLMDGGLAADAGFIATLMIDKDVRWRTTSETTGLEAVVASGQTWWVANDGTDDAYPEYVIDPYLAKTGSYLYKRWIPAIWRAGAPYAKYPTDICNDSFDTSALVGAAKMQADGDDLRVWVDGAEVDRWLDGINTATTKVWVNLDFQAAQQATLEAAIAGAGAVDTIDVNESITGFPSMGILLIGTEAFTYTGKNNSLQRFTGVDRAARGTAAGAHGIGDAVWWIQHDIWILYGNAAATAPAVDGDYEPIFELDASTNTSWVYEEFGETDGLRPGQWNGQILFDSPYHYSANHATYANPWEEIGIRAVPESWGRYKAYNPCGITNANFNGQKWAYIITAPAIFNAEIVSSVDGVYWPLEYDIPLPAAPSNWEAWSRNEALDAGSLYVALDVRNELPAWLGGTYDARAEAADCTLTLDNTYTPTITIIGSEQGNYLLDCDLENLTTGEGIHLDYVADIGTTELHVDTNAKTVRNIGVGTGEDTNEFQALTLVGGPRRDWLRLQPGNNQLRFTDVGTNGVDVYTNFEERYY